MKNKSTIHWGQTLSVFSQHWFKIGLVTLGLYAFLSRDFSFKISIHAPNETPANRSMQPASDTKKETLTDNGLSNKPEASHFDLIPSWGNNSNISLIQQLESIDAAIIDNFINRFKEVAIIEQEKHGIPTSIILANALLQSQAGTAIYTQKGNNYFSLDCSGNWDGGTQDQAGGCMRSYDNAWLSFRDHSLFLTTGTHTHFKKLGNNKPAWANALGEIYPQHKNLNKELLLVVERLGF